MSHHHRVDVGDPQKDMSLAICSCGWKIRVSESEELSSIEAHTELMALAYGHVYANAWVVLDNETTATEDASNDEHFASDGL